MHKMCSILDTDYLALKFWKPMRIDKANTRRGVLVNTKCLLFVTSKGGEELAIKGILVY